ncbi:MAG TPA: type II CAAX endopeptidase family protein [Candidatus Acidoferrales bacterium]
MFDNEKPPLPQNVGPDAHPTPADEASDLRPEPDAFSHGAARESVQQISALRFSQFPEDLRGPWDWTDLFLLIALVILGTILISLLLGIIFGAFGIRVSQIQHSSEVKGIFVVASQAILSLGLLGYLAAQMRLRFGQPFWRTIGWRKLDTGGFPRWGAYLGLVAGGMSLSMLVALSASAFGGKAKLPIQTLFQNRLSAFLVMAMAVLIAPVFEETIFRGYMYPVLARSWGVTASVIVTGTIFGLLHAAQLWGGWGQIALLVVVGIIFTYVRAVTRTVLASYLLHVSYNSFLFILYAVASHGFRHLPIP